MPTASSTNPSDFVLISQSGATRSIALSVLFGGLQATNTQLTALAALSGTGVVERTGANTFAVFSVSSTGKSLMASASKSAMRTFLELGSGSTLNVPATGNAAAGELVKGNDTRLTDARTPTAHTHAANTITGLGTAATLDVAPTGDATSSQVVKGDDTRLAGARTPTAHAASHGPAGSDPITPGGIGAAAAVHGHANTDITGLGTMSTQNANNVSITGGTIAGVTFSAAVFGALTLTVTGTVARIITFPDAAINVAAQDGATAALESTTTTIDLSKPTPLYTLTLTGSRGLAFTGGNVGRTFKLLISQDGTGGYSVTWPAGTKWGANGTAPTQTTGANKADLYEFTISAANVFRGVQLSKDSA